MGAIDLSARIQAINRMNGAEHRSTPKKAKKEVSFVPDPKKVWKTDDIEGIWETAQEENYIDKSGATLDQIYKELQALTDAVSEQAAELKKINKHINATQKMLKKKNQ